MTLQDRIKKVAASTAPSMVPGESNLPVPLSKEDEAVPSIHDLVADRRTCTELARLTAEYGELGEEKHNIQKQQDNISAKIKAIMGAHQIAKALSGEWRLNYYDSPRSSIKQERLLARGVSLADIDYATVTTHSYALRVTRQMLQDEA